MIDKINTDFNNKQIKKQDKPKFKPLNKVSCKFDNFSTNSGKALRSAVLGQVTFKGGIPLSKIPNAFWTGERDLESFLMPHLMKENVFLRVMGVVAQKTGKDAKELIDKCKMNPKVLTLESPIEITNSNTTGNKIGDEVQSSCQKLYNKYRTIREAYKYRDENQAIIQKRKNLNKDEEILTFMKSYVDQNNVHNSLIKEKDIIGYKTKINQTHANPYTSFLESLQVEKKSLPINEAERKIQQEFADRWRASMATEAIKKALISKQLKPDELLNTLREVVCLPEEL